ncbi:PEPxxWA-CTERM sorting domain-containing protein [Sphingomonas qilianensis]|uniref:PEPxxWA-CTERM sorting domain-containing protein n=1 Tax=Sphingomonas qilianensis TaxID=1736690 RepID=A0ABU9XT15_9SPHN
MILSAFSRTTVAALAMVLSTEAAASTFVFDSDPFAGTTALTTPGRQVIGGETFITFDIANDLFVFDRSAFGLWGGISFGTGTVSGLPTSGLNVIVVGDTDNDADLGTPFGAGSAANLLANRITSDGAGFFIYFNSALDQPRLVFSTNLSEPTADLKILARLTNLAGNPGSLANFTASNFQFAAAIPEPASWVMMVSGFGLVGASLRRRARAAASYA